jgi:hypothetical protein
MAANELKFTCKCIACGNKFTLTLANDGGCDAKTP